jgi:hypothetical protein
MKGVGVEKLSENMGMLWRKRSCPSQRNILSGCLEGRVVTTLNHIKNRPIIFIYLFFYDLFNDDASSSNYVTSNSKIISRKRTGMCRRAGARVWGKNCPGICLHAQGETTKTLSQESQCSSWDWKRDLLKAKQESYPLSREVRDVNFRSKNLGTTLSCLGLLYYEGRSLRICRPHYDLKDILNRKLHDCITRHWLCLHLAFYWFSNIWVL